MTLCPPPLRTALLISLVTCLWSGISAAESLHFHGRLSPLPVDFRSASSITGSGTLGAELTGSRLRIWGGFKGLQGEATAVRLHRGPLAIAGPALAELTLSGGTSGKISGELSLSAEQVRQLHARELYVQVYSRAAPEGNLRGWLLPGDPSTPDEYSR